MDESRIPILVGCGQITQREADPAAAQSPMDLTASAARLAAENSGAGDALLQALDTVLVLRSFSDSSWRFASPFGQQTNPPKSLAGRIGAGGATGARRLIYTYAGGNMVQWSINRFFEMITRGEMGAALIAGGEALATQKAAQRAGLELDWHEDPGGEPEMWGVDKRGWNEVEDRHRMAGAIFAYPLFETAIRGHHGRSIEEHGAAMGALFSRFAAVAAANPLADRRQGYSAAQIATPGPDNPYIGFPYTKLMNANAFIDQSAALILTSAAKARALGIAQDKWVYLHGCADAYDHWYISDRKNFHSSPAMHSVGEEAFAMADTDLDQIGAFDIYSCFPSAVQIACQEMGIATDDPRGLTVTGGLPYFGGPGNNYVTHSIAEMMNRVRAKPGMKGLVTSNGNYVTKQSAGIYSTDAPDKPFAPKDPGIYQAVINANKGRRSVEAAQGAAEIETYAVMHDRAGPSYAIVMGLLEDGRRFIANTPDDGALLADMVGNDYLSAPGKVAHDEGLNIFTPD
ncbi:MAG: acetyl-CoA acetyltransferase [Alphaproteobacteria bacterium]|jgi:acetyl-CoA C-acetyltransferase|nr:acetyl-CoA acetyltransferase [Alphaproteobacteria bacterium]